VSDRCLWILDGRQLAEVGGSFRNNVIAEPLREIDAVPAAPLSDVGAARRKKKRLHRRLFGFFPAGLSLAMPRPLDGGVPGWFNWMK